MKAVYASAYGSPDVLEIRDIDVPVPADGEILVQVRAAGVSRANSMMREGRPFFARLMLGLTNPKHAVPGSTFEGEVMAIGPNTAGFAVGDRVAGETGERGGCLAQFLSMPAKGVVVKMPESVPFPVGAVVCDGGITGYNFMAVVAQVKSGQRVLINGASGAVGSSAVQVAKSLGAHVTGVCSKVNGDYVKSLGADTVINYRESDFATERGKYDVVFDTVGNYSLNKVRGVLTERGQYVTSVLSGQILGSMLLSSLFGKQKAKLAATGLADVGLQREWMNKVFQMIESGEMQVEITRSYALDDIREASTFVDSGRKRGNVVVEMVRD